jgi:DNA-binding NarL/FixJ family response regulator
MAATCNGCPAWPPYACAMGLRCLIVDDSHEFLDAAARLLRQQGMDVAGVTTTGDEAIRLARELKPDVTLIDIDLNGEDGFVVARRLAEVDNPGGHLVFISTYAEEEFAELVESSPGIGFVAKSSLSAAAIDHLIRQATG